MIADAKVDDTRQPAANRSYPIVGAAIVSALLAGLFAAVTGPVAIVVAAGFSVLVVVAWRPVLATYLYLATIPFLAGMERGELVPLLRPNEALLVLVIVGAVIGGYVRAVRGTPIHLRLHPWDESLAAFFLLATVWPLASMLMRVLRPDAADLFAILPACKLAALLLLVRATVRTQAHVLWCIRVTIGGAAAVAAIAVMQTLDVSPVVSLLEAWWHADADTASAHARGTTTLANSIATGDYIVIGLALLVTAGVRGLVGRRTQLCAGLILIAGLLAAGQFSTWIGAVIVGTLLLRHLPMVRMSALRFSPLLGVAALIGAPALLGRLEGFSGGSLPQSWLVRWDNVTHLYVPELIKNGHFLVGVSPNSVVVPPDTWRDVVYLESGYLQFLWMGGVPLLVGFLLLSAAVLKLTRRLTSLPDGVAACGLTLVVAWWMILVLSLMDAHLFMRGPGDLLFALVGIVTSAAAQGTTNDASG